MKLYIGNKNYSSWSMRPWVLMKNAGIAFEEMMLPFGTMQAGGAFKNAIEAVSPVGKVPVLVDSVDGGALVVWDTLAICEYLAEKFPSHKLWPEDAKVRARARSIVAEMHSGFGALRSACPMNIEASLPEIGAIALRDTPAVRADLLRIEQMFSALLEQHGGPYLFGSRFTVADAFYAPVCMRLKTYALSRDESINGYVQYICGSAGVREWIEGGLAEHDFVVVDEPYRIKP